MGIFRRKSWEERQKDRVGRLERKAEVEESKAQIRKNTITAEDRLEQARSSGRRKGSSWGDRLSKVGAGLEKASGGVQKASKASGAMSESFMNIDVNPQIPGFSMPGQQPRKSTKKKRKKKIVIQF